MEKSIKSMSFITACIILEILLAGCGTNSTTTQANPQQTNTHIQNQTATYTKSNLEDTPLNHSGQTVQLEPVPTLDMQPIKYSQAQLTEVRNTAKIVGVKAFLPQIGTTGDQLTIVKNGGSSLILDYKNIWIVESTVPIHKPTPTDADNESDISSTVKWQYITTDFGGNSSLYLQKENTYICIENLHGPLTEWQLMAIASSLQSAQS